MLKLTYRKQEKHMKNIKGKLGFGCMRLPYIQDKIDIEQTKKMVDIFLEEGFNYFDTAHGYLNEQSEYIVKECLTSRYSRDKYILATKLSPNYFEKNEDIIKDIEIGLAKTDGKYIVISDRREAIFSAIHNAEEGDMVAIIGKGHEDYQEIEGVRHHFKDREVVEEAVKELK